MSSQLRAVVIGAGWAGEGHVKALRHCGVEVAAICARQPEVVREVAGRLEVPEASTDWPETMTRVRPDVVTLAVPASARAEPVELACQLGCHVYSEKALAPTAPDARRLLEMVEAAGVKHAFGTTHGYSPAIVYLAELVREGAIGTLREIEMTFRLAFYTPLRPWSWADTLAAGGGMLGLAVVHTFAELERLVGGPIVRATGETRLARERAPYIPGIHDLRLASSRAPTAEEAERLEWRICDVDGACTALLRLAPESGGTEVQAVLAGNATMPARASENGWRLHGDQGTLLASGVFAPKLQISLLTDPNTEPRTLEVPERLVEAVPKVGDDIENNWAALFRDFTADVRGEPHGAYPTFHDGWRYQVVIDAIRAAEGWQEVPR